MENPDRWTRWWPRARALALFSLGAFLALNEASQPKADPVIVAFAAAAVGLEVVWRGAEKINNRNQK